MTSDSDRHREVYSLDQEMERAAALLDRGIVGQKGLYICETARFLLLVDLAGGAERMLKLAWAMAVRQRDGAYPSALEFKKMGHGLVRLVNAVADLYPQEFLTKYPDAQWAQAFLREDPLFRELLKILDHFSGHGWYFHVDSLGGNIPDGDGPERAWSTLELRVWNALYPDVGERSRLMTDPREDTGRLAVGAEMALAFELLGCAMFRLFVVGLPDTDGRQWSPLWQRYLRVWRSGELLGARRVSSLHPC